MRLWQWIVVVAVVVALFVVGLSERSNVADETHITSREAHRMIEEGARLVDVRSPQEFAQGHIEGAVNVPLQQLGERLDELKPQDQPMIVYCRSGHRSGQAANMLLEAGFEDVRDLGPMSAW